MAKIKLSDGKEIQMREPKVKDMKLVSNIADEFEKELALIVNLTGLTPDEVEDLSMKDFNKIDEVLKGFLS
jgi:hypothetical protein